MPNKSAENHPAGIFLPKGISKKAEIRTAAFSILIVITLIACMTNIAIRNELAESIDKYNKLLSSQSFDAAGLFAAESIAKEFSARIKAAKNIKIVDYSIEKTDYDEENGKAEVAVKIDYYSISSYKVNTVLDVQKWEYITQKGAKQWRLMSLLPEFP